MVKKKQKKKHQKMCVKCWNNLCTWLIVNPFTLYYRLYHGNQAYEYGIIGYTVGINDVVSLDFGRPVHNDVV